MRAAATTKRRPRSRAARTSCSTELVERYLGLADSLARRYRYTSESMDDLVQVARMGLVKAAHRWDPTRGVAFTTYAVPTIVGELRRHFRDKTWVVRVPRDMQELYLAAQGQRERLWQELGREPTAGDVAACLNRPVEDIVEAFEAGAGYAPSSLDAPFGEARDGDTRQDFLADPRDEFGDCENAVVLEQLTAELSERDREVFRLRFCEDLTQREIGERVGCSQMHVSRILRDGIRLLQARAGSFDH
jgi:RNA polymerase sigma-B factor